MSLVPWRLARQLSEIIRRAASGQLPWRGAAPGSADDMVERETGRGKEAERRERLIRKFSAKSEVENALGII